MNLYILLYTVLQVVTVPFGEHLASEMLWVRECQFLKVLMTAACSRVHHNLYVEMYSEYLSISFNCRPSLCS